MKKGDGWFENIFSMDGFKELNIHNCGKRLHNLNHHFGPAIRSFFLIIYVKEGQATLLSHKDKIRLTAGSLLVMFPDSEVYYVTDKDVPWTIYWIGMHGTLVPEFMKNLGLSPENPVYNVKNRYEIEDILEKIYNLSYSQMYSDKLAILSHLYNFFSVLLSEKSNISPKDYAAEVKELIRKNFDKDISIEQIATRLSVNKNYLTRVFKEKYNMTIKDFLINIRLKRAMVLLKETDADILKISNSVGYSDQLYFSRIFRKKTGLSPSEYRKKLI